MRIYGILDAVGTYVREGLLDIRLTYNVAFMALFQWYKWKDVIEEQRKRYYTAMWLQDWEYYVDEVIKYLEKQGQPYTPPANFAKYIPDQ